MSVPRSAAILVAVLALFGLAGRAAASTSRLTAVPPVPLSSPAPAPTPTGPPGTPSAPSGLPRTGSDIPGELLAAALLLGTGGVLRLRWSTARS